MKRRRHTPEQIVRKLREADRLLAEGGDAPGVCRHLEISAEQDLRSEPQEVFVAAADTCRSIHGYV
jgi:putative transposase